MRQSTEGFVATRIEADFGTFTAEDIHWSLFIFALLDIVFVVITILIVEQCKDRKQIVRASLGILTILVCGCYSMAVFYLYKLFDTSPVVGWIYIPAGILLMIIALGEILYLPKKSN